MVECYSLLDLVGVVAVKLRVPLAKGFEAMRLLGRQEKISVRSACLATLAGYTPGPPRR